MFDYIEDGCVGIIFFYYLIIQALDLGVTHHVMFLLFTIACIKLLP